MSDANSKITEVKSVIAPNYAALLLDSSVLDFSQLQPRSAGVENRESPEYLTSQNRQFKVPFTMPENASAFAGQAGTATITMCVNWSPTKRSEKVLTPEQIAECDAAVATLTALAPDKRTQTLINKIKVIAKQNSRK
jgi:hypothetical protein